MKVIPEEKRERYFKWRDTPLKERKIKTKMGFARHLGVSIVTIYNWEKVPKVEDKYDSKAFLISRSPAMDKALITTCEKFNAQALKLYNQLTGRLVERIDHTVRRGYDPDELAQIELELERRRAECASGAESGMEIVQGKPALLPEKICENQG